MKAAVGTRLVDPKLLRRLYAAYFAWSDDHEVDTAASVLHILFLNDWVTDDLRIDAINVLRRLIHVGMDELARNPMKGFQLDINDAHFVETAAGLHLLLDQIPRTCFKGTDVRWTGRFDEVDQNLALQLLALPDAINIYSSACWQHLSFERSFIRRSIFCTSFVHCEIEHLHSLGDILGEQQRREAEKHYDTRDVHRDTEASENKDTTLFAKVIAEEIPANLVSAADGVFHVIFIDRIHTPIIQKFGRYPYRNSWLGRTTTSAEEDWLEITGHFSECDPSTARAIREDVESGHWRPLHPP